MITLLAQVEDKIGGKEIRGIGPLGFEGKRPSDLFDFFPSIISTIVGVLTGAAILWFIIQFAMGAIRWIGAGGDSKQVESARSQIMQAVIGLIIIFSALVLLSVLGGIFGLDILNLKDILLKLDPKRTNPAGIGGGTGP